MDNHSVRGENMSFYASKIIELAMAEVGYLEKASNKNLDSKTGNAGSGNYTKYARDIDAIPHFYNGAKQGHPWCDVFYDWLFVKLYGPENAKKILCQPSDSCGASCTWSHRYMRAKNRVFETPQVGDQIFFRTKAGVIHHTGLVYKVDKSSVYTIEGNTSSEAGVVDNGGSVAKKKYSLNSTVIAGYGRPFYDAEPEKPEEQPEDKPEEKKEDTFTMEMRLLKKGCKGEDVRSLQILLIGRGFNCGSTGADGDFGTATHKAVVAFQKAKGLAQDGIAGPKTLNALWGK